MRHRPISIWICRCRRLHISRHCRARRTVPVHAWMRSFPASPVEGVVAVPAPVRSSSPAPPNSLWCRPLHQCHLRRRSRSPPHSLLSPALRSLPASNLFHSCRQRARRLHCRRRGHRSGFHHRGCRSHCRRRACHRCRSRAAGHSPRRPRQCRCAVAEQLVVPVPAIYGSDRCRHGRCRSRPGPRDGVGTARAIECVVPAGPSDGQMLSLLWQGERSFSDRRSNSSLEPGSRRMVGGAGRELLQDEVAPVGRTGIALQQDLRVGPCRRRCWPGSPGRRRPSRSEAVLRR